MGASPKRVAGRMSCDRQRSQDITRRRDTDQECRIAMAAGHRMIDMFPVNCDRGDTVLIFLILPVS
jgi:hypothetical protein